jgi:cytoskeletal protein RodZ
LEQGQVERLPGRVFVVNYIRAYAQTVGMEPDDAVLRFEEVDGIKSVESEPEPVLKDRKDRKSWTRAVVGLGGLIAALGAIGLVLSRLLGAR